MHIWPRTQRRVGDREIPGYLRPVFIHNGNYYLADLKVYADGMVDCWQLVTFEHFKDKVEDGWVVTSLPEGAEVGIFQVAHFMVGEVTWALPEGDLVKEVADLIEELNGRPTSADRCREALRAYHAAPGEPTRQALREAYEAVPEHERRFLGDQDMKDHAIRMLIYGDQEVEAWSHRRAAAAAGLPLPTIDPKKELDRAFGPKPEPDEAAAVKSALDMLYRQLLRDEPGVAAARALVRSGDLVGALRVASERARAELAASAGRPQRLTRLAGVLFHVGELLFSFGQRDAARAAFEAGDVADPDSLAALGLARFALLEKDAILARRAVDHLQGTEMNAAILTHPKLLGLGKLVEGLDIPALLALAGEAGES